MAQGKGAMGRGKAMWDPWYSLQPNGKMVKW